MNEMTSVATNGSWVTTIMKIRAGSRGARRAQSAERRSAPLGCLPAASGAPPRGRSSVVLIASPSRLSRMSTERDPCGGAAAGQWDPRPSPSRLLPVAVALGYVVREFLPAFERVVDRGLAGDRGADLLGHLGPQVGELGDADELDPRRRTGLHARVVRVGGEDRLERGLRERRRLCHVVGVLIGRG